MTPMTNTVEKLVLAAPRGYCAGVDRRRDAVGREDGRRALRDGVVELVDEDRAPRAQLLHDVLVVDDLLADVHGRPVELQRPLYRLNGTVNAGAVTTRRGKQELLRGVRHCHRRIERA